MCSIDEEGQRSQGGEICLFCGFVSCLLAFQSMARQRVYKQNMESYSDVSKGRKSTSEVTGTSNFRIPLRAASRSFLRSSFRHTPVIYPHPRCRIPTRYTRSRSSSGYARSRFSSGHVCPRFSSTIGNK